MTGGIADRLGEAAAGREAAAALRFLRELAVRSARRIEALPWGVAVFDDELSHVWDLNAVWVDGLPPGTPPEQLAAEVERVQSAAGLGHGHAIFAGGGERAAEAFRARGWSCKRHVLMAHRRPPDRPQQPGLACEIDEETARRFTEASLRRDPAAFSDEVIRQIATTKAIAAAAGARFFAARVDGTVASTCDLYSDGRVAQIEAVMTLEEHRNRGLARAVVLEAVTEARAAGNELVFLQAEAEDWPKALYRKLGFDPIGVTHVFMRSPV